MLYFLRHGETYFTKYGIFEADVPLIADGIIKAQQINLTVDTVICSPLRRTRETLHHSNIIYSELIISELAREEMNGNQINYLIGERIVLEENFTQRLEALKSLINTYTLCGKSVLVISHHGVISKLVNVNPAPGQLILV